MTPNTPASLKYLNIHLLSQPAALTPLPRMSFLSLAHLEKFWHPSRPTFSVKFLASTLAKILFAPIDLGSYLNYSTKPCPIKASQLLPTEWLLRADRASAVL